jgi:putative oxidoreductase
MPNYYLLLAGLFNLCAALLHIAVIVGGPRWYRMFGAGEAMARMAEQKRLAPTIITLGIALVLLIWGAYAWSAAGLLISLPFTKVVLTVVTAVYLLRGIGGFIAPWLSKSELIQQNSLKFWLWSSLICLAIGLCHLKGLSDQWTFLH